MWPGSHPSGSVVLLLPFECSIGDFSGKQEGHHMVQCIRVINLKVMNVQARILASVKGNLGIW